MIINHNLNSMNAHRNMSFNTTQTGKAMEKLSSGLRINRAGDDAAGLAISEKMRGQIRGLDQATRNSQDAISLIQTAEGALNETHSILQRMRELSVQSSNDTTTDADRNEIQKEVSQLKSEVDRISNTTEFNTKKLLDGSVAKNANSTSSFANTGLTGVKVSNDDLKADTYTVTVAAGADEVFTEISDTTDVTSIAITGGSTVEMGNYTLEAQTNSGDNTQLDYLLKDANGKELATVTAAKSATTVAIGGFDFTVPNSSGDTTGEGTLKFSVGQSATFTVTDSTSTTVGTTTLVNDTSGKVNVGGLEFTFNSDLAAGTNDADIKIQDNSLEFQIGANENQTVKLALGDMDTAGLDIADLDVSNKTGAQVAITKLDEAIQSVSGERSKLGANQNRLEHTINNLSTSAENLQAAESRIRDVDMAKEMMNFTKNNILNQAAQAMLAQAKSQPEAVLQLLR
ncbi:MULTISPECIES: flagellin [unclassified Exiguobacterium]|uniref:flagellin N-terminal helical domain-containing protein n=1 Tax=unclassified Exiguobacterium TaxID=2644629 RepID=UPI001BE87E4F|nr:MULTISPECIES: flagellin [unclassified Exiguobacterium]